MKTRIWLSVILFSAFVLVSACKQNYSCTDGEQNQGETGIDCGDAAGLCPPCANMPNCSDGIQNGGELGVDCGGPCSNPCNNPPAPTCTDGIQNQGETGVDCGGPCTPCSSPTNAMSALIDSSPWSGTDVSGLDTGGKLNLIGKTYNATDTIEVRLVHGGAFATGTYDFTAINPATYLQGNIQCISSAGTITFTTFNTTTKLVIGSFEFGCTDAGGGTGTHNITSGTFEITYN
ncbi:MAG: hypothetical protein IPM47_13825 [Sphingobacteriales bacterium]|nr:MAG: hypothetical protein IPM47_13825 [Sphingobacteriales bacterium]